MFCCISFCLIGLVIFLAYYFISLTRDRKFLYLETFINFTNTFTLRYFETRFLENSEKFLGTLDKKTCLKIIYLIDLAEQTNDPRLFKKLQNEIWEFRIQYSGKKFRFLAFWDKSDHKQTLVLTTHGFIKKSEKVPKREIQKANEIRNKYFELKQKT